MISIIIILLVGITQEIRDERRRWEPITTVVICKSQYFVGPFDNNTQLKQTTAMFYE